MVFASGLHTDGASALLRQVLADQQTQADSFTVHLCGAEKFAELLEEAINVFRKDSFSCVDDVHFEHFFGLVEGQYHADYPPATELERVLYQVYEYLFKSDLVAEQALW